MPTTAGVSKYFARGNRIVFAGWGFGSVFRDLHRELQSTHCPATGKTQNPPVATPCRFESGHRHHQAEPGRNSRSGLSFLFCPFSRVFSGYVFCQRFLRRGEALCLAALFLRKIRLRRSSGRSSPKKVSLTARCRCQPFSVKGKDVFFLAACANCGYLFLYRRRARTCGLRRVFYPRL